MLLTKIAFRNIFRQTRRSVLTALAMTGGFVLAAFSISWSDGSYHEVIDLFTRSRLGHIQIHAAGYLDRPALYRTIPDARLVGRRVAALPAVESWAPRIFSAGLVAVGEKSAGARIVGIDPEREIRTTHFGRQMKAGRLFSSNVAREAILGSGLADLIRARPGDRIVVLSQGADGSIANDAFTVTGLVDTGDEVSNLTNFYLPLGTAQELLVLEGRVHEIVVTVHAPRHVRSTAAEIEAFLSAPELEVAPWQEFANEFYRAMRADQIGMWITLAVIILVVAVGVLNTVLMSVLERRREYGVLKALGTQPRQVFQLILVEINLIALGSLGVGALLAFGIIHFFAIHGITLPQPITYGGIEFSSLHTEINVRSFVIPALTVAAAASIAGLFPAYRAAGTEPAAAMRTT